MKRGGAAEYDSHQLAQADDRELLRLAVSATMVKGEDDEIAAALDAIAADLEIVWGLISSENLHASNLLNAAQCRLLVVAALQRRTLEPSK